MSMLPRYRRQEKERGGLKAVCGRLRCWLLTRGLVIVPTYVVLSVIDLYIRICL